MLRHLILGVLRDGGARHGYAIMKEYRDAVGTEASVGSFYRELQRLVEDGFVRGVANPSGADPRRIPYEITPRGCVEFDRRLPALLEEPMVERQDELALRAFLISRASDALALDMIARWRADLSVRAQVARLAHQATGRTTNGSGAGRSTSLRLLLFGRRSQQAAADEAFAEQFERAWSTSLGRLTTTDRRESSKRPGKGRTSLGGAV